MTSAIVESICVFGSIARATADGLSDKDVLIVVSDPVRRIELLNFWQCLGWSVSVYSPKRFEAICQAGSLFVQHLKLEGQIVSDRGAWLTKRLLTYQTRQTYEIEAQNSVSLALPIEHFADDQPLTANLICTDLAYVSVRNFGVCQLADMEIYTFDYDQLVDAISDIRNLSPHETKLVRSLRVGKSKYRSRKQLMKFDGSIGDLKEVLGRIFPRRRLGTLPDEARRPRCLGAGYSSLRDIEASIVSRLGRLPTIEEIESYGLMPVWKFIQRPSHYTWSIRQQGFSSHFLPTVGSYLRQKSKYRKKEFLL